jgi:2-polyprenyl-3-methyl-5-hydroxy-6-metoxy-1,4-benzoquinol methylase
MSATNESARAAWNANAAFWDARMADGNDFFEMLVWPSVSKLLALEPHEQVLDLACGNGVTTRRLHQAGVRVIGTDFSEKQIERARSRSPEMDYRIVDCTDESAVAALGEQDAVLCNMALMDIADPPAVMRAVKRVLRPGGRFVFSVTHPAFNNPWTLRTAELEDRDGEIVTTYAIKIPRYLTPGSRLGNAIVGQPEPHPYFHLSLSALLTPAFAAGLVLDALEEPAFPPGYKAGSLPLSWNGSYSDLPPLLVARLRRN